MSSGATSTLELIGHDWVQSFVSISSEGFLIAIYAVLVFQTARILLRKGRTKISMITLGAICTMFVLGLTIWLIDCVNFVAEARITLIDDPDGDLAGKYGDAIEFISRRAAIISMLYAYMSNIGDAIIIWRVYAFWSSGRERLVLVIPGVMLLASIITSIMLTYCVARLGSDIELGTFQKPAFCRNIQTTTYCTAFATTAAATILIGIKAWKYRHNTKPLVMSRAKRTGTKVERIMILLAESGMLYCLFFLVQVLMSIDTLNARIEAKAGLTFALTVFEFITGAIVGIYPTIIVILVHSNRGTLDSMSIASTSRSHTSRIVELRPAASTDAPTTLYHGSNQSKTMSTRTDLQGSDVELHHLDSVHNDGQHVQVWKAEV